MATSTQGDLGPTPTADSTATELTEAVDTLMDRCAETTAAIELDEIAPDADDDSQRRVYEAIRVAERRVTRSLAVGGRFPLPGDDD